MPLADIFSTALDVLLPQTCLLCGSLTRTQICPGCYKDLPWQFNPCPQCGIAMPTAALVCGNCLKRPPYFESTQTLFAYQYPLDQLIQAGKYKDSLHTLRALAKLMRDHIDIADFRPDVIMAVPLHPARLRERGYNQAALLAKPIARQCQIPLNLTACRCIKHKRQQVGLSDKDRRRNVRGAFVIDYFEPGWQRVAIVDDVMTTGATMNEVSKQVLRAGASHVEAWCCARRN
jgi:ComF family protein